MEESPFPEIVEVKITDSFDLHSIPPPDVRRVTEEYLRLAREKGFRVVRIIHGKGIGVQREIVRRTLAETDFIEGFKDAPPFAGHWGATIVKILPSLKVEKLKTKPDCENFGESLSGL